MNTERYDNKIWAIVPAAGIGARMQADKPKQYLRVHDKTIIEHTLDKLLEFSAISSVVVCTAPEDKYWAELGIAYSERLSRVDGGETRAHSVLNGLLYLSNIASDDDWVMVHDAARPCISLDALQRLVNELCDSDIGGLLAVPVHDTVKLASDETHTLVKQTLDRSRLWYAQTPQMFRFAVLKKALEQALEKSFNITDEASAIELIGLQPTLVMGEVSNIKVTTAADMSLLNLFIES